MTKQIEQSIVRIKDKDGRVFGAGFLVKEGGIVSCSHVVADSLGIERNTKERPASEVFLDFPLLNVSTNGRAEIKHWNAESDITLLTLLSDVPHGAFPVDLEELENYDNCNFTACGFPENNGGTDWAHGIMYGRNESRHILIQSYTTQPGKAYQGVVRAGFSGGPVWHHEVNKLAGMVVAHHSITPRAYIIPASEILQELPCLKISAKKQKKIKHACFLSFPVNSNDNDLILTAVKEIQLGLKDELSARTTEFDVFAETDRTAMDLCESACMIMIYTPLYFDRSNILCAQEYRAMSKLEKVRLAALGIARKEKNRFILSIVIRNQDDLKVKIAPSHPVHDFQNYFLVNSNPREGNNNYGIAIKEIADYVFDQCQIINRHLENPCTDCERFELPSQLDVDDLLQDYRPSFVI